MMERFKGTITKVNKLIKQFAPAEFKKSWQVSVGDGTVAFGSSLPQLGNYRSLHAEIRNIIQRHF